MRRRARLKRVARGHYRTLDGRYEFHDDGDGWTAEARDRVDEERILVGGMYAPRYETLTEACFDVGAIEDR